MKQMFVIRFNRMVNLRQLIEPARVINAWESPTQKYPGVDAPPHMSNHRELTVWVERPQTLLGIALDHNEEWPGLQLTIINPDTNQALVGPLEKRSFDSHLNSWTI